HVFSLDEAKFVQAFLESSHEMGPFGGRSAVEKPDHGHCRLLRTRRERPRRRRAAEKSDELAPDHSITLSARASSVRRTVSPSALAVLRLMISSTLVACWTGRAACLLAFSIRPGLVPGWRS